MADIYLRPYDNRSSRPLRMVILAIVIVVATGALWWWLNRPEPENQPVAEETVAPQPEIATESTPVTEQPLSPDAQRTFDQAQSLAAAGKLAEASKLLGQVISSSPDGSLKNNALRTQGRINMKLFLSDVPTENKKRYVIQPGDSLDRIARRNDTTVDLIRKMNGIEGNLIYPGASLMLPAAPLVVKVDKSARHLDLMMNGKLFKRYIVGLGRYGKTPLGEFHTVVHQKNPDWSPPTGGIVPFGDPRNVLGTRWISIQDEDRPEIKGFGIHGTSDRESIGGETSNGCIRMLNEDVEEVFLLIPRGTEVIINE